MFKQYASIIYKILVQVDLTHLHLLVLVELVYFHLLVQVEVVHFNLLVPVKLVHFHLPVLVELVHFHILVLANTYTTTSITTSILTLKAIHSDTLRSCRFLHSLTTLKVSQPTL